MSEFRIKKRPGSECSTQERDWDSVERKGERERGCFFLLSPTVLWRSHLSPFLRSRQHLDLLRRGQLRITCHFSAKGLFWSMKTLKVWNSVMSFPMNEKFASRFCMLPKDHKGGQLKGYTPVYLNVYDLTPMNGYVYWAGLGIFHSGVEVHGVEYAFGAHDHSMSGVFEVEPRHCPGFRFRKSILIGKTCLDPVQVREFMEQHSVNYSGDTYHLIVKNCNHFCNDVCYKLTGKSIPRWVNRLAKIGSRCSCILPQPLRVTAVCHTDSEKVKLRSIFCCLSSISMRQKQVSASSLLLPPPSQGRHTSLKAGRCGITPLKER